MKSKERSNRAGWEMTPIGKSSLLEEIQQAIYLFRGQKIMLDRDLASLYGVPTKALKQSVRRNASRFPNDFMFVLTPNEFATWRSQFVTSKSDRKGLRHAPMAFTDQGVAMLSSVLKSERAVQVNIAIMRTFVQLRQWLATHKEFAQKLKEVEKINDIRFKMVFEAIRQLQEKARPVERPPEPPKRQIGFRVEESRARYGRGKDASHPRNKKASC